jgi:hypothetical protein
MVNAERMLCGMCEALMVPWSACDVASVENLWLRGVHVMW